MSDREWISRIGDPVLRERVRRVLIQLLILSDAPSSKPRLAPTDDERRGAKSGGMKAKEAVKHQESAIPRGVNLNRDSDAPPARDRLYEWHAWHLERAGDDELRVLRLCYQAEHDIKRAKWGPKDWRKQTDKDNERQHESDEALEARIISAYEGMDSVEVATVYEERHPQFIEKIRARHGRNPRTGEVIEGWTAWSEEEKVAVVTDMRNRGLSQRQIAAELNLKSKKPIQTRWNQANAA